MRSKNGIRLRRAIAHPLSGHCAMLPEGGCERTQRGTRFEVDERHAMKGPLVGTDPTIDKDDARLDRMLEGSICRGC